MSSLTLAEFWNTPSKVTYSPYIAYNRLLCYQQSKLDATPNHDNLPWHTLPTILRQEIHSMNDQHDAIANAIMMIYKISIDQNPKHCQDLVSKHGGYNALPFLLQCIARTMGRRECHYACIALSNLAILEANQQVMTQDDNSVLGSIMDITSHVLQRDPENAQILCYCLLHLCYARPQLLTMQRMDPTATSRHSLLRILEIFLHDLMHAMPVSHVMMMQPVKIQLEPAPLCLAAATLRSIAALVQALAREETNAELILQTSIPSYVLEILLRLDRAELWPMHGLGDVCLRVILNLARRKEFKRRQERLGPQDYKDTINIALSVITEEVGLQSLKGLVICVLMGEPLSQFLPGTSRQLVDVMKMLVGMQNHTASGAESASFVYAHQEYIRLILDLSTVVKAYRNLVVSATRKWEFNEIGSPDAIACLFTIISMPHYDDGSKAYAVDSLVRLIPAFLNNTDPMDTELKIVDSVPDLSSLQQEVAEDIHQVLWQYGNPLEGRIQTNAHRNALKAAEKIRQATTTSWDSPVLTQAHQQWKSYEQVESSQKPGTLTL